MKRRPIFIDVNHFVDAVVGYRAWRPAVRNGVVTLRSFTGMEWEPGVDVRASCPWHRFDRHAPPGDFCDCGVWAYDDLAVMDRQLESAPYVFGEVCLWGDIIEHGSGYRAEFARVSGIIMRRCGGLRPELMRLTADRYRVPLLQDVARVQ